MEYGEWTVDINADEDAVVLEFLHMGQDGVEAAFETAMSRQDALDLAEALRSKASELA